MVTMMNPADPRAGMFGGNLDSPWAKAAMIIGPAMMAYGFENPSLAAIGPQLLGMDYAQRKEDREAEEERSFRERVAGMFGPTAAGAAPGAPPGSAPATGGMFSYLTPEQRQIALTMAAEDPTAALRYAGGIDPKDTPSGTFEGTGLQGQAWNILLDPSADPGSQAYAAAYSIVSQPRIQQVPTPDGGTVFAQITPEVPSNIRRPTYAGAPQVPAQPEGAQPPPTTQPVSTGVPGTTVTPLPGTEQPRRFNQDQTKAAGFANRAVASADAVDRLEDEGFDPSSILEQRGAVPVVGNLLASDEYQQYQRNQLDFITAVLRRESGAAISETEFANEAAKYFPQPGDSADVIRDKRNARRRAIDSLIADSQGAYESMFPPTMPLSAPAPDSDIMPDLANMPRPTTQEGYDAIPSGAWYIDPDTGDPIRKR